MRLVERPVLDHVGVTQSIRSWHNQAPAELYEHTVRRGETAIVASGALAAATGQQTGRSPHDKFFVRGADLSGQDLVVPGQPADGA